MIQDYGTTVLVATLLMPCISAKSARRWATTGRPPRYASVCSVESRAPGLKAEIESRMHIVCTDNYGLTEVMGPGVSGECLAERDMQHIAEDHSCGKWLTPKPANLLPMVRWESLFLPRLTSRQFRFCAIARMT